MLPEDLLSFRPVVRYVRPDGSPHRGTVYLDPAVPSVRSAEYGLIILSTVAMPMSGTGNVESHILNPHDPTITPGGEDDDIWLYHVREVYEGGPTLMYSFEVPDDLEDGAELNLAEVERIDERQMQSGTGTGAIVMGPRGPRGPVGPEGPEGPPGSGGTLEPAYTIDDLLAQEVFFVAHRGSGAEFPEHTMVGYEASAAALTANGYVPAIEVSVVSAGDKTVFCLHDLSFDRTTDAEGNALDWSWAAIHNLVRTDDTDFLGPGWQGQGLSTLHEVLDRFFGKAIIFLETKDNPSFTAVQNMLLNDYPGAQDSIVWKKPFDSVTNPIMSGLGFAVWGFVTNNTTDEELDEWDEHITMWGVPDNMQPSRIAQIVARGKPVICWEVHRRSQVQQLVELGVQGMMCSQVLYVTRTPTFAFNLQMSETDSFSTQIKSPGNMGRLGYNRAYELTYNEDGEAWFEIPAQRSALMGTLSNDPAPSNYFIRYEMMWPTAPAAGLHSGIAFCKEDDRPFLFGSENPTGGYHVVARAGGSLELFMHVPESPTGQMLAANPGTGPITSGTWMSIEVEVTPTQIFVRRTDVTPTIEISSSNTDYRAGAYFHLSTNSVESGASSPRWRNVSQTLE